MITDIDSACYIIHVASLASSYERAIVFLEWSGRSGFQASMTPAEIARVLREHSVANLNNARLRNQLDGDPRVTVRGNAYAIKPVAGRDIQALCPKLFDPPAPDIDQENAYLPQSVWSSTRSYVEDVCAELNGCVAMGFLNAAAVLLRRLVETLLIEAFVKLGRDQEIKNSDGNYMMLNGLVAAAKNSGGIGLGRDARSGLDDIKKLGDRAAHNPRFRAARGDLQKVEGAVRVLVQELIEIGGLRSK